MSSSALAHLDSFFPIKGEAKGGTRKYEGGDRGRRTERFPQNGKSANLDVGADAVKLRQRSRHLYQNTVYSHRAVNAIANGVVGKGIVPSFTIKGKPEKESKVLKAIKQAWQAWSGEEQLDIRNGCDFHGRLTFYGIQKLVAKTMSRDGECLILRRRVPLRDNPYGMQLQVLEMEYLADYINYQVLPSGGWTYSGIEYDKRGKAVAYWLFQRHPSEWYTLPERVSVDELIHVGKVDFPAQNRFVPKSATTLITESDLDEFEDAEIMAKKVQASFAVARVRTDATMNAEYEASDNRDDYDTDIEKIEPGTIYDLYPGEQLQSITPPTSPGGEDYRKSQHRKIASGYEVMYEMMTGDLSNVNFSSYRSGWLEQNKSFEDLQWITMIPQFCNRVIAWFLEQLLIAPKGINKMPDDLLVTWTTPRRDMISPQEETEALLMQMRMGTKPWSEAVRELGDNPDAVLEAYKRDRKMWEEAGMKGDWSVDLVPNMKGTVVASPPGDSGGDGAGDKKKE